MSRGPGTLGRRVLARLGVARGGSLPWAELRESFPLEASQKTLQRAVRSLERGGYVFVGREGGKPRYVSLVDRKQCGEVMNLQKMALGMVATLAKARRVPVPKLGEKIPDRPPVRSVPR